jgi:hypothetical protein
MHLDGAVILPATAAASHAATPLHGFTESMRLPGASTQSSDTSVTRCRWPAGSYQAASAVGGGAQLHTGRASRRRNSTCSTGSPPDEALWAGGSRSRRASAMSSSADAMQEHAMWLVHSSEPDCCYVQQDKLE